VHTPTESRAKKALHDHRLSRLTRGLHENTQLCRKLALSQATSKTALSQATTSRLCRKLALLQIGSVENWLCLTLLSKCHPNWLCRRPPATDGSPG